MILTTPTTGYQGIAVLSARFEVGVSLLLAPDGADKRGLPLVENTGIQPAVCKRVRLEPGLTESTGV